MSVYQNQLLLDTLEGRDSFIDITDEVNRLVKDSQINKGIVCVSTPHTTCAVFFEEYTHDRDDKGDDFLLVDFSKGLETIFPPHLSADSYHYPGEKHYQAVASWPNPEQWLPGGDRKALWNADAHLKASLIGSSETIPITENTLAIGKTGYLYFVDFDRTRRRERRVQVTVIGE